MLSCKHADNLSAILIQKGRMHMADFIFYHDKPMSLHTLMNMHNASMNIFSELSQYNKPHGDLSGMCSKHIEVTPDAIQHYIDVAGYANNDGYLKNRLEFLPSYLGGLSQQQRQSFCKTTTQVLQKLAKENYPNHAGSVTFFDWGTPRIYLFDNPDTESANTPTPSPSKTLKTDNVDVENEDINSPLSTSADSIGNQRRLIQRQQQALNDDDENKQETPDKPTTPQQIVDDNLQREQQLQVEQQQADAVNDDDDEKEKRDRRRQQRRTKQRLTKEQEAEIIRERCLAEEAKRNAELKHPTNKWRNSSGNHGSRGGHNGPTVPDGPSL